MQKTQNKLKIALYSPYLSILGGGERYILSIASYISKKYDVTVFAAQQDVRKAEKILNIPLDAVALLDPQELTRKNFMQRNLFLSQYDYFFYMTDGSIPIGGAKKNYLIIQSPAHTPKNSVLNRVKLRKWKIICYSRFMQNIISKQLGIKAMILNPPVEVEEFSGNIKSKQNYILTVGRFFKGLHDKKQEEMADIFMHNYKNYFRGWEFILIGGLTDENGKQIVKNIQNKTQGYPIKIFTDISYRQLVEYYKQSKIYWHGAGFEENIIKHPEKAEHFGITTIEAMAAGCVPVVFKAGGQKDIIREAENGYFWSDEKELLKKTNNLIQNQNIWVEISMRAKKDAIQYSTKYFYENLEKIITV
jgi:glycosyltransferase involved in cell wall biosynthesis